MKNRKAYVIYFDNDRLKYCYFDGTSRSDLGDYWRKYNLFDLELEAMHRVKELNLELAESLMKEANS